MSNQRIGWRPYAPLMNSVDADATAFISAAGITDLTQASAINTLVLQLKAYGIWSKMKALYPMVGGTAAKHRFNLKDPRAVDAAFYLDFNGTWTHSSTGAKPDGLTGYANTKMNLYTTVGATSLSHSTYIRLNAFKGVFGGVYSPVAIPGIYDSVVSLQGVSNTSVKTFMGNTWGEGLTSTVSALSGMVMGNRINALGTIFTLNKNESKIATSASFSVRKFPSLPYSIGALNDNGTIKYFDNNEIAFYHIGDGMTDAEAANFYNAVQTYQTTLGRNIGTAISAVSDSDAITFIATAGITDVTQQYAINTLVTDLKAAGVWTKMKAIYPFVGGSAAQHRFNLKDPRAVDAAFYLDFFGGGIHGPNGYLPNGTTAYANTKLTPSVSLDASSAHFSYYSRTATTSDTKNYVMGADNAYGFTAIILRNNTKYFRHTINNSSFEDASYSGTLSTNGLFVGTQDGTNTKLFRNGTNIGQNTAKDPKQERVNLPLFIGADNNVGTASDHTTAESAFASIGDGLTDAQATAFYTAVQKYQTSLGRQVGTPVLASGQTAGLLETYPSALVAYSLRKLRAGYAGSAIRVRRSSDNTEQDIAFDASGNLDTTSLLAFVGSGSGYVAKWYDQSGSTNHLIKTTAANQPRIVNAGTIETVGTKPAVRWTLISNNELLSMTTPLTNVQSVFLNITYQSGSTYAPLLGHSSLYDYHSNTLEYLNGTHASSYVLNGTKYINGVSKTNATFTKSTSNSLISMIHTSASGRVDQISSDRTVGVNIFEYRCFSGYYSEIVLYSSNQTANRAAIESNINSYYAIY
jgi:hypothetical protein